MLGTNSFVDHQTFPGVLDLTVVPALLYVECNTTPDPLRPFLVAGLVAKFLAEDESYRWGASFIGERANGHAKEILPDIRAGLKHFYSPSLKTFEFLFHLIPQAEHLTCSSQQLVVELQRMNDEGIMVLLEVLPCRVISLTARLTHIDNLKIKCPLRISSIRI